MCEEVERLRFVRDGTQKALHARGSFFGTTAVLLSVVRDLLLCVRSARAVAGVCNCCALSARVADIVACVVISSACQRSRLPESCDMIPPFAKKTTAAARFLLLCIWIDLCFVRTWAGTKNIVMVQLHLRYVRCVRAAVIANCGSASSMGSGRA